MNKILIFVSFLFLLGCNYNQSKNPVSLKDQEPQKITSPDQLTYKIINQNVLATACLNCHSASGGNRGGINLETYEKVFAAKDDIKTAVANKAMPPASQQALSDQQIKMIIDWIDAGALENGKIADEQPKPTPPTPPTPPPQTIPPPTLPPTPPTPPVAKPPPAIEVPVNITFADVNAKVIKTNCTECHSVKGGNRGGINLETYEKVFAEKDRIKAEVASKSMPPASKQALSDQQIKMIIDWIDAGALENGKIADEQPKPTPPTPPTPTPPTPPVAKPPPVVEVPVKISFAEVNAKVIKTNCTQCHSAAGGNRGGVNLETYDNVFVNRLEVKFQVENGSMPTKRGTPLTDVQKKLLLTWIEQGAVEKPL